MSAIWHDYGQPSFMGVGPRFSFFDFPEIHAEAPAAYATARFELLAREHALGAEYYQHQAKLAYRFWLLKRPWWLCG